MLTHESETEISHGKLGMALFSGHVEYEMSPPSCNCFWIKKTEHVGYPEQTNEEFSLHWNLHPSMYKPYIASCNYFKNYYYIVNPSTLKVAFN